MTNFFDRLAARALGVASVARPFILPITAAGPRFEPASAPTEASIEVTRPTSTRNSVVTPADLRESLPRHEEVSPMDAQVFGEVTPAIDGRNNFVEMANVKRSPLDQRTFPNSVPSLLARVQSESHAPRLPNEMNTFQKDAATAPSARARFARIELGSDRIVAHPVPVVIPSASVRQTPVYPPQLPRSFDAIEPPVIRITIGRVDVRAQFSPPAPLTAADRPKRASTLSLEEYAKQRREGRR
jgi:hypothetical protein